MHSINTHRYLRMLVEVLLFALATIALVALITVAQAQRTARGGPVITPPPGAPAPRHVLQTPQAQTPIFRDYHGVNLGMARAEVHQKLGTPSSTDDRQEVFNVTEMQVAQVFYDRQGQVSAFTVNYLGDPKAPTAQQVFGAPCEVREDGSIYKMVRYETAGLWIVYTSTAENPPFVTIAVQKIN